MAVKKEIEETPQAEADNPVVLTRRKRIWLRLKKLFKLLMWLVLLVVIVVGGFFLGVYLRVFDTNAMNEKLELYKYPVLNEYFVKPEPTAESEAAKDSEPAAKSNSTANNAKAPDNNAKAVDKNAKAPEVKPTDVSKPIVLTKEEIAKQTKLRQAEEKKRIGKLARLYNEMTPTDAAAILDGLNDDMIIAILNKMDESQVAKILVEFDTNKSTRLTREVYNGRPPTVLNTPIDTVATDAAAVNR